MWDLELDFFESTRILKKSPNVAVGSSEPILRQIDIQLSDTALLDFV